jgi:hypothetical protein
MAATISGSLALLREVFSEIHSARLRAIAERGGGSPLPCPNRFQATGKRPNITPW